MRGFSLFSAGSLLRDKLAMADGHYNAWEGLHSGSLFV